MEDALKARYLGDGARGYNALRAKSARWRIEHEIVGRMLEPFAGRTVLDLPIGTGRFVPHYRRLGCSLIGADLSPDMLSEARRAAEAENYVPERLLEADATRMDPAEVACDLAVSVRFFNWLDPERAARAFANISAAARTAYIVSLTSIDVDQLEPEARTRRIERLEIQHREPQPNGLPPNAAHRWDHFRSWAADNGWRIERSELVQSNPRGLANHVHLLLRA